MNDENLNLTKIGKHKVIETFEPDSRLKLVWVTEFIVAYLIMILAIIGFIAFLTAVDDDMILSVVDIIIIGSPWFFGISLPLLMLSMICVWVYINAISYSLTTHEIIVEKGIITKSRKVVPYRNITNFNQRRGPFDRLIGGPDFGTIGIETAGMSGAGGGGKTHPEQKIVGVVNTTEYTEKIRNILSRMKGQAAVTADAEIASSLSDEELLKEMLYTLKDISKKL
ncbi:MAG: PH domain-containing protein [Candidatus Heimdallarchaeota archaeon]|nr:PH domain-containing protein [Candidatus Heimdallarchaeota archaeon]MCK4609758.1 PH domain-containing protein [Candidatus Heimdallarchaeota archaeon]